MRYEILTRQAAFALGRKHFYTGRPCKHGHDARRFTSTGGCMACNASRSQTFSHGVASNMFAYALHPDDHAAALAYCQALDMQRGRTPTPAGAKPQRSSEPFVLPADLARFREQAIEHGIQLAMPALKPSYLPKP